MGELGRTFQHLQNEASRAVIQNYSVQQRGREMFRSNDARMIVGLCKRCREEGEMGIVVGKTGYGKSFALRECARVPGTVYIECDCTMSRKNLLEAIETALGVPSVGYGDLWHRVNVIRDVLNTSSTQRRLLIIDEADKLITRNSQTKMEVLRAIYDQSNVGIVLAGELRLTSEISRYLGQLENRIQYRYQLSGLTAKEVEEYVAGNGFVVEPDALETLKDRACGKRRGCFRLLDKTLVNALRILQDRADSAPISVKVLEDASGMMAL